MSGTVSKLKNSSSFWLDAQRTNPDIEMLHFNYGMNHWSIRMDEAFEKHLEALSKNKTKHLWYGISGMPNLKGSKNGKSGSSDKMDR